MSDGSFEPGAFSSPPWACFPPPARGLASSQAGARSGPRGDRRHRRLDLVVDARLGRRRSSRALVQGPLARGACSARRPSFSGACSSTRALLIGPGPVPWVGAFLHRCSQTVSSSLSACSVFLQLWWAQGGCAPEFPGDQPRPGLSGGGYRVPLGEQPPAGEVKGLPGGRCRGHRAGRNLVT